MPRQRKQPALPRLEDEQVHLPAIRHEHERRVDPLQSLPAGGQSPEFREQRKAKDAVRLESRYDRYLEALIQSGGEIVEALADTYGISREEATARREELRADVRAGAGQSSIAEILERQDLSKAARVAMLRKHVFSSNPAASLKAIDMLNEMDSGTADGSSYESWLRLALAGG